MQSNPWKILVGKCIRMIHGVLRWKRLHETLQKVLVIPDISRFRKELGSTEALKYQTDEFRL
jgi:hypothetical protein